MAHAALELTELTLRTGRLPSLSGVTLTVQAGAFLTVLGAGGAGKSALMAVLEGQTRPSAGLVTFNGASLQGVAPQRRGFGVVRQSDSLFPDRSLAENVAYPLRLRRVPARERARLVDAALDSVMIPQGRVLARDADPATRMRAALARATVFGPRLLLLDEPLGRESPSDRPAMLAVLRRLHLMLGVTTVMTTRIAGDALALSDQVAMLDGGQLGQVGSANAVYDTPNSATAARLTGEINLLGGVVQAIDEDGIARVKLDCGPVVEGTLNGGLRQRDRCLFGLRPERIAVAPTRADDMGEDALAATVLEVLVLGDALRLRVLLGTGEEMLVKRPAAAGTRGLMPGKQVAIAWQMQHAAVFSRK
jgi:ABC-type Fe3+/spermidine/putrescine transport system ATPase subunit